MRRGRAADILTPYAVTGVSESEIEKACEMGAEALMPWIKTEDRPPTEKDADMGCVFAKHMAFGGEAHRVKYRAVAENPKIFPLWMHIPPFPEVDV